MSHQSKPSLPLKQLPEVRETAMANESALTRKTKVVEDKFTLNLNSNKNESKTATWQDTSYTYLIKLHLFCLSSSEMCNIFEQLIGSHDIVHSLLLSFNCIPSLVYAATDDSKLIEPPIRP